MSAPNPGEKPKLGMIVPRRHGPGSSSYAGAARASDAARPVAHASDAASSQRERTISKAYPSASRERNADDHRCVLRLIVHLQLHVDRHLDLALRRHEM